MNPLLLHSDVDAIAAKFTDLFPELPQDRSCLVWAGLTVEYIKKRYPRVTPALVGGSAFFPITKDPASVPEPKPTEVGFLWGDPFSNRIARAANVNPEFHAWCMVMDGPMSLVNPLTIDLAAEHLPRHFGNFLRLQGVEWDPACFLPRGMQRPARQLMGHGNPLYVPDPDATRFVRQKWADFSDEHSLHLAF
jgi:hypothetical protein